MVSLYVDCDSGLLHRGEQLFPFTSFDEQVDWDGVLEYLDGIDWGWDG